MLTALVFLFLLCNVSYIEGSKFRHDYSFSQEAGGWLKLHRVPATWNDAQLLCHAEGAVLASPLTRQLRDKMVQTASAVSARALFTGVHTMHAKGVYASVEGVPLSSLSISWAPGEPDNYENSESCLAMLTAANGTMCDLRCTEVLPFICYKEKKEVLVINGCGTHDKEYIFYQKTGSCYKFHRSGLNWNGAYRTCMAEGAHLIVINSEVENQALKEVYSLNPDSTIFAKQPYASIGVYLNPGDAGYWMTVHGETPTEAGFDKWGGGEPNNGSQPRGEFCAVTHRNNGYLHDAPCDWIMPFICEMKPTSFEDVSADVIY